MIRSAPVLLAVIAFSCSSEKSAPVANKTASEKSPAALAAKTKTRPAKTETGPAKTIAEKGSNEPKTGGSKAEESNTTPAVAKVDPDAPPQPKPSSAFIDLESEAGKTWAGHTGSVPFILGYEKGRAYAEKNGKPVMYFVSATWCRYCKLMAKDNFDNAEIKKLLEGFVCVLVDQDAEPREARRLGSVGVPHVVFASSDGRHLDAQTGAKSAEVFRGVIQSVAARLQE